MCLYTGASVPVALTCVSLQFMDEIKSLSKIFKASYPPHPQVIFLCHKLWTQQINVQLESFLLRIKQYKKKIYREMGLYSAALSIWVPDGIELSDSLTSLLCPSTNLFLVPNGKITGCASEPVWTM